MRWTFLAIAVCGFASLWGVGPGSAQFAAFVVMFVNFATFCVLFDRPKDRARWRVADYLHRLNPSTDVTQRLATAPITLTVADRHLGFGPMTILNLATAIAAACLLIWGIGLRIF